MISHKMFVSLLVCGLLVLSGCSSKRPIYTRIILTNDGKEEVTRIVLSPYFASASVCFVPSDADPKRAKEWAAVLCWSLENGETSMTRVTGTTKEGFMMRFEQVCREANWKSRRVFVFDNHPQPTEELLQTVNEVLEKAGCAVSPTKKRVVF